MIGMLIITLLVMYIILSYPVNAIFLILIDKELSRLNVRFGTSRIVWSFIASPVTLPKNVFLYIG